jgi:hypothetical protein
MFWLFAILSEVKPNSLKHSNEIFLYAAFIDASLKPFGCELHEDGE